MILHVTFSLQLPLNTTYLRNCFLKSSAARSNITPYSQNNVNSIQIDKGRVVSDSNTTKLQVVNARRSFYKFYHITSCLETGEAVG